MENCPANHDHQPLTDGRALSADFDHDPSGSPPTSWPPGPSRSSAMCMIAWPIASPRSRTVPFSIWAAGTAFWRSHLPDSAPGGFAAGSSMEHSLTVTKRGA